MLDDDQRWFSISLRVMSDDVDPDEISAALGLQPESKGRKGEHISGNPRYALYETNMWVQGYLEEPYEPFCDYLSGFLTVLENRGDALREISSRTNVRAQLYLGYGASSGQGGFMIPAPSMARIAALGLELELDLYPPTIDEEMGRGEQ
jgi:hypothetical protein